jgi:hypothetical protein
MASANDPPKGRPQFEYYRGYPARFRKDRRRAIVCGLIWPGSLFLLALAGLACAAYVVGTSSSAAAIWRLIGLGLLTSFFGVGLVVVLRIKARTMIVPYFKTALGDICTFAQGYVVARSCQALDELALQNGLTPLSAYGFNDDWDGEVLTWHPPAQGLATFAGLLNLLAGRPDFFPRQDKLVQELSNIRDALHKAADRDVPFCLLLYSAGGTNSIEWERRQGTCF